MNRRKTRELRAETGEVGKTAYDRWGKGLPPEGKKRPGELVKGFETETYGYMQEKGGLSGYEDEKGVIKEDEVLYREGTTMPARRKTAKRAKKRRIKEVVAQRRRQRGRTTPQSPTPQSIYQKSLVV